MPNSIINQRARELPPIYRDYILSGEVSAIANEFSQAHNLSEASATALENGIFLFMLFFLSKSSFINFLKENCDLTEHDAGVLVEAILLSLPINIRELQQQSTLLVFAETSTDINSDIAETEATINALNSRPVSVNPPQYAPSQENTYTSLQSAILRENRPLSIPVPPPAPNANRWETENN